MSHCTRPAQQRQAAIAQHAQAADIHGFFNLLTSPELRRGLSPGSAGGGYFPGERRTVGGGPGSPPGQGYGRARLVSGVARGVRGGRSDAGRQLLLHVFSDRHDA